MKSLLLGATAALAWVGAAHADTHVVSMKGAAAGNPYWAAFEEGANAKGKELGVNVLVVSPPSETDVQAQI
jgi:ribose transport system substrate-binding protein